MKGLRGEIWVVRLDPGAEGHEIRKTRPCVVIQTDALNRHRAASIVAALTEHSDRKASYPFCVPLETGEGGVVKPSVVNAAQVRTVDETRLIRRLGALPSERMREVDRALRIALDLD